MATSDRIAELLAPLPPEPGYFDLQRVGRQLLELYAEGVTPPGGSEARIALAGSFTLDPLGPALAVECAREGIQAVVHIDGFNLYRQHLLDPRSPLYAFEPRLVFLAAELPSLTPLLAQDGGEDALVSDAQSRLEELVAAFTRSSDALLVVHNFVLPARFPFSISQERGTRLYTRLNDWLGERWRDDPQVHVLDYELLASVHGKGRAANPKLRHLAGMEISETFLPVVTHAYMAYVKAMLGLTRKCLALDLDDTLWGGVVGEVGAEGIQLARTGPGSEYRELQETILDLHRRGVLLSLNTKNNPDDALPVLRSHPDMVLREEHFASMQINWRDKVTNMRAIADELNIGLDSLVFVDSNPVEQAWVREALPEVLVVDLGPDPSGYAAAIERLNDFEALVVTEEDRRRSELYAAERRRRELESASGSFESFLSSLEMVLSVALLEARDVPRVAQLTRRTNQFNMTTRRYSDAEVAALVGDPDALVYSLRQRDSFGDAGLVGVVMLRRSDEHWSVDTFLMSCRVLGRTIEHAFLTEVLADAQRRGIDSIRAVFMPTAKNGPAAGFYEDFGFEAVGGEDDTRLWELELASRIHGQPPWFRIEWKSPGDGETVELAHR